MDMEKQRPSIVFNLQSIPFNGIENLSRADKRIMVSAFQSFLSTGPIYTDTKPGLLRPVPKWIIRNGQPWPNTALEDGTYLYTLMPDGELRISRSPKEAVAMSHADLALGNPVRVAGNLFVESGKIRHINNKSGHYNPDPMSCIYAKAAFKFWGIPICDGCDQTDYT